MERSGNFYKAIRLGYILISILVGCIAYTSFYEWQKLEGLEEENRQIDRFRLQLHSAYVQMIEFSLLGETILEWDANECTQIHNRDKDVCPREIYRFPTPVVPVRG